jgi:hypothetical protein
MAKDPAFLMYHQDWLLGTQYLSYSQKGKYIDLLCHQADKGVIPKKIFKKISGKDFGDLITSYFKEDSEGFYNLKLKEVMEKRKAFAESRRRNRMSKTSSKSLGHKENVNENENENVNSKNNKPRKKFVKPSLPELTAYIGMLRARVNPHQFLDHYEANGWKIGGKAPMKDWKAAVRTWARNNYGAGSAGSEPPPSKQIVIKDKKPEKSK